MRLPDEMTYEESLGPAMEITDQEEADRYFKALVERHVRITGDTHENALSITKSNLAYYAGYYERETASRVQRLYNCVHPVFGTHWPTGDEAFAAGIKAGEEGFIEVDQPE